MTLARYLRALHQYLFIQRESERDMLNVTANTLRFAQILTEVCKLICDEFNYGRVK
jgi:hypothetical protein